MYHRVAEIPSGSLVALCDTPTLCSASRGAAKVYTSSAYPNVVAVFAGLLGTPGPFRGGYL